MSTAQETAEVWRQSSLVDEVTKAEIERLLADENTLELEDCFGQPLVFGTGGLRGLLGVGTNRMNLYTVQLTTEGWARHLAAHPEDSRSGVVIGYDSRRFSREFAEAAAEVFAGHGIPTWVFREVAPTPLVSFELLRRKARAGLVITASHNPAEYNGYKIYGSNGGQVIPPEDGEIVNEVRRIQRLDEIQRMSYATGQAKALIQELGNERDVDYLDTLEALALGSVAENRNLGVVYTPFHGTGGRCVPTLLERRGFAVQVVAEQIQPDGEFPTLATPNPEEEQAFELARKTTNSRHDLILSNDPDSDRLGVMVRNGDEWVWLNGNQIGALLLDFMLSGMQQSGTLPENGVYVASFVSSPLGKRIAQAYGLQTRDVLTGFKWIRNAAEQCIGEGEQFIFGMEESHGFLMGLHCGDKDGVWAAMAFAELCAALKAKNSSPLQQLEHLQQQHGQHLDRLVSISLPGLEGRARIQQQLQILRKAPPRSLGGLVVESLTDLSNNTRLDLQTNTTQAGPGLPSANVLLLQLEQEGRVIVRPSGTEPKIKFYFNLRGEDAPALNELYERLVQDIVP
jgi:phosphoglucomutase